MITACKEYITDYNRNTIWDQPYSLLVEKCTNCLKLGEEYQRIFNKTKKSIAESEDEKQFDFSETYIFGKINSFAGNVNTVTVYILANSTSS